MSYDKVTPRARQGTTGVNVEADLLGGNGIWLNPPERVAAITIAVHIPPEQTGSYTVETCCNRPETIGVDGMGGYWDNVYGDGTVLTEDSVIMLANAVTGIRVNRIAARSHINVAFCS